jgi:Rad3-related DNA helicase
MNVQRATGLDGRALRLKVLAGCAAGVSYTLARRCRMLGFLIAAGTSSSFAAFAQTGNCRVTHIDYHERRALQSVEALITAPYVLSSYPYVPASSAQRQPSQSEAARIAPDIARQNPDVVVVHGSTFTGSANLRRALGELIRSVDRAKADIRGFVVYSSAMLDATALSIDEPLRSKLQFMYAPIVNRFRPPDPSAKVLSDHVQRLCGI